MALLLPVVAVGAAGAAYRSLEEHRAAEREADGVSVAQCGMLPLDPRDREADGVLTGAVILLDGYITGSATDVDMASAPVDAGASE